MTIAFRNSHGMSGSIHRNPASVKMESLRRQLDYFEQELQFFMEIAEMAMQNGTEFRRPKITEIIKELAVFRDEVLPRLKHVIDSTDQHRSITLISETESFERYQYQFQKIKLKFFPLLSEIEQASLW